MDDEMPEIYDYPKHVKENLLTNRAYDILKYVAQIGLPALGTLYFALAGIWGFPHGEQVIGSVAAVNVFIGAIIGLSNKAYNESDARYDGAIQVEYTEDSKKLYSLSLSQDDLENLDAKDEVTFKVVGA